MSPQYLNMAATRCNTLTLTIAAATRVKGGGRTVGPQAAVSTAFKSGVVSPVLQSAIVRKGYTVGGEAC
jgi:hypothetical protein